MALREIRQEGDEILKKRAREVKEINQSILTLLDDMMETLIQKDGVGIAAPQLGVLKRVAVVSYEDETYEMINPVIVSEEGKQNCNEACLSVPGRCGDVERPFRLTVKATNRHGEEYTFTVEDFMASVVSHELDHLDGILFLDRATSVQFLNDSQMERRRRARRKRLKKK